MEAPEAVEYSETVLAQCSAYIQRDARRKVLKAMDIIKASVDSIKEKPDAKKEDNAE